MKSLTFENTFSSSSSLREKCGIYSFKNYFYKKLFLFLTITFMYRTYCNRIHPHPITLSTSPCPSHVFFLTFTYLNLFKYFAVCRAYLKFKKCERLRLYPTLKRLGFRAAAVHLPGARWRNRNSARPEQRLQLFLARGGGGTFPECTLYQHGGGGGGGFPKSGHLAEWHTAEALSRHSVLWGDCDHGGVGACSGKARRPGGEGAGGDSALAGAGLAELGRGLGSLRGRWRRRLSPSLPKTLSLRLLAPSKLSAQGSEPWPSASSHRNFCEAC